jgi:hypothetical protein
MQAVLVCHAMQMAEFGSEVTEISKAGMAAEDVIEGDVAWTGRLDARHLERVPGGGYLFR